MAFRTVSRRKVGRGSGRFERRLRPLNAAVTEAFGGTGVVARGKPRASHPVSKAADPDSVLDSLPRSVKRCGRPFAPAHVPPSASSPASEGLRAIGLGPWTGKSVTDAVEAGWNRHLHGIFRRGCEVDSMGA